MKKLLCLLSCLFLTGCAASGGSQSYRQVSMDAAMEMMESEQNYIILDVRTGQEFASGPIPGAINIPHEPIGPQAPAAPPDKKKLSLVYFGSGTRSKQGSNKQAARGETKD